MYVVIMLSKELKPVMMGIRQMEMDVVVAVNLKIPIPVQEIMNVKVEIVMKQNHQLYVNHFLSVEIVS